MDCDDVSISGDECSLSTESQTPTKQQNEALVEKILQSSPVLDRFITRLTSNDELATRFFRRIITDESMTEKMCTAMATDQDGNQTEPDDNSLAGQFVGHLFKYYSLSEMFWTRLIDDDLFAEAVLEPVFATEEMLEGVTDRLLERKELMELM